MHGRAVQQRVGALERQLQLIHNLFGRYTPEDPQIRETAPDLLGLTFLMAWSGGVAISPMSGLHLFIQGRFGVPAHSYLRWNARFTAAMLFIDVTALFTYEHMLA